MSGAKNFKELCSSYIIVIPQIQRDYAEGRETESVEKKRTSLLQDMLDVAFDPNKSLSLDFVYGITSQNVFKPLDGQQRLTTLFLLHWLLGRKGDIVDNSGHSLFVYETRETSKDFCHWLMTLDPLDIIPEWEESACAAELPDPTDGHIPSLLEHFMSKDEFKWEWHIDPNIRSMIVVLETACKLVQQKFGKCTWCLRLKHNDNLDNIRFEVLDKLDCDGDELFEKMNARGKALSSFDLLKSSLEEELDKQNNPKINDWRIKIDQAWIYFCWDNSNIPDNPTLDDVKGVEKKLERLLIRLIGKSFFDKNINSTPVQQVGMESPGVALGDCILSADCDQVADRYFKYARYERGCNNKNQNLTPLDFSSIIDDFDHLIYQEKGPSGLNVWKDIARYLHEHGLKMHPGNDKTVLDDFLNDSLTHEARVIAYGMFAYLRRRDARTLVSVPVEFENFKEWMRFLRNVFLRANKNNPIDKPELVRNAVAAINSWLDAFFNTYRTPNPSGKEMLSFICDHIVQNPERQEKERLEEEALKAGIRLGKEPVASGSPSVWDAAILSAEKNPYLWGQIIAPLSWSKIGGGYDIDLFRSYMSKIDRLFSTTSLNNNTSTGLLLIKAVLSEQEYTFNGSASWGSLGILNDDRDVSWKRHLRDKDSRTGYYGILLKDLMDKWGNPYPNNYLVFLNALTYGNLPAISDWRYCLCYMKCHQLRDLFNSIPTSYRYISIENGKAIIYRSTTKRVDAVRYELGTLYLYLLYHGENGGRVGRQTVTDIPFWSTKDGSTKGTPSQTQGCTYDIDHKGTIHSAVPVTDLEKELIKLGVKP